MKYSEWGDLKEQIQDLMANGYDCQNCNGNYPHHDHRKHNENGGCHHHCTDKVLEKKVDELIKCIIPCIEDKIDKIEKKESCYFEAISCLKDDLINLIKTWYYTKIECEELFSTKSIKQADLNKVAKAVFNE